MHPVNNAREGVRQYGNLKKVAFVIMSIRENVRIICRTPSSESMADCFARKENMPKCAVNTSERTVICVKANYYLVPKESVENQGIRHLQQIDCVTVLGLGIVC